MFSLTSIFLRQGSQASADSLRQIRARESQSLEEFFEGRRTEQRLLNLEQKYERLLKLAMDKFALTTSDLEDLVKEVESGGVSLKASEHGSSFSEVPRGARKCSKCERISGDHHSACMYCGAAFI